MYSAGCHDDVYSTHKQQKEVNWIYIYHLNACGDIRNICTSVQRKCLDGFIYTYVNELFTHLLGGSACSFKKIDIGCSGGGVAQWSTLPPPEQKIAGSNKGCMVVGFYIEILLRK
jgi:hypothetical protein